jgi:glycerol-3-phosphate dehydrogenase (NAD(P)+)
MAAQEDVLIWAREPDVAAAINEAHANPLFLPGIALSPRVKATTELADLAGIDPWLVVPPAQFLGRVLSAAPMAHRPTLILCAKGIEAGTHRLMADVAAAAAPQSPLAVLSGPSFAAEVAKGLPTAVTLAAATEAEASALADRLARPTFRPYASNDVTGAEIGGAVKNVLAIACGVVIGAGLGENARAAIIARGFAEMTRFGLARGARAGKLSVAEGAATAPVLVEAAAAAGVDMPISAAVADLLEGRATVPDVVRRLLSRPLKSEGL